MRRALVDYDELGDRRAMAGVYQELGNITRMRERRYEAGQWYRKALAIHTELGDRQAALGIYSLLELIAGERGHMVDALEWAIKAVNLFPRFPDAATERIAGRLAFVSRLLGMHVLEDSWRAVTAAELPGPVRDYVDRWTPEGSAP
jgi:tetratricopeptide (TPR) repeat protein